MFEKGSNQYIRPSQGASKQYGEYIVLSQLNITPTSINITRLNERIEVPKNDSIFKRVHHIEIAHGITSIDYFCDSGLWR